MQLGGILSHYHIPLGRCRNLIGRRERWTALHSGNLPWLRWRTWMKVQGWGRPGTRDCHTQPWHHDFSVGCHPQGPILIPIPGGDPLPVE